MDNGDVCFTLFQSLQLPGVQSLKRASIAVFFTLTNAEICISERLGHITVRDDYECAESSMFNARAVSTSGVRSSTASGSRSCVKMEMISRVGSSC